MDWAKKPLVTSFFRKLFNRCTLTGAIAFAILLATGSFVLWLNGATRATWELQNLQREYTQRSRALAKARANCTATEIAEAKIDFNIWQDHARAHTMRVAARHPGTIAEAAALLMLSNTWPDSVEGSAAIQKLPKAALSTGIGEWATAIERFRMTDPDIDRWRPLVSQFVERVDRERNHPDAASLLCKAGGLIRPDVYAETGLCDK